MILSDAGVGVEVEAEQTPMKLVRSRRKIHLFSGFSEPVVVTFVHSKVEQQKVVK
jgi:hypothetical protein